MAAAFPLLQGRPLFAALLLLAVLPHAARGQAVQCGTTDKCGQLSPGQPNVINELLCQSGSIETDCNTEVNANSGFRTDLIRSSGGNLRGTQQPGSFDATACCNACKNNNACDAWSYNGNNARCFHITSTDCGGANVQSVQRVSQPNWRTGMGGTGARDRCINRGTSSGCLDPHYSVQTTAGLASQEFTFDFHGLANRVYCMLSDLALQLNVRMFGIPPSATVLERQPDLGDDFFNGTWMNAIGFVYVSKGGDPESLTVELDQAEARAGIFPFHVAHDGQDLTEALATQGGVTWSSPHGDVTVTRAPADFSVLSVVIEGMLNMKISADVEKDVIVDPPIHFLNFQLNSIEITPNVHGFLGQMYAPGAIEERLAMGTLDGFRHREYVEGPDEDYQSSDLTARDCKVTRFGGRFEPGSDVSSASDASATAFSRRLLAGGQVPRLLTGSDPSAVPSSVCHPARRGAALSISCSLEV